MNNTVLKTIDILKLLAANKNGLPLAKIVKALNLPKSTVHNILKTLASEDIVSVAGDSSPVYRLGIGSLKIGLSYLDGTSLDSVARPILSELSRSTNETVFMSVRCSSNELVYVMKFMSSSEFQTTYSVGAVRPLLSLAMGKAMLCVLPEQEVRSTMTPDQFLCCSHPEITDIDSLLGYLQESRLLGYATETSSENQFYNSVVACPVLDMNGSLAAAISIVIMRDPGNEDRVHQLGQLVNATALNISNGLGFMGNSLFFRQ